MPIDLDNNLHLNAKICVIGVGGAGGNAVDNMINRSVEGVTFIAANTDKQALDKTLASEKILLGETLTKGLGAGSNPERGKKAAEESIDLIKNAIAGYDLIFVTCGMGGGTGTGGSPVIARIAKDTGALVVGIVSKCFTRDGGKKLALADSGIAALRENVDSIIVVPNDKILECCKGVRLTEAYNKANDILHNAITGITDIIVNGSYQNVDFADVRTTLTNAGDVIIGIGSGTGDNAAREAVTSALNSPFLDGLAIQNSDRILVNIQAGNYPIDMIDDAYTALREAAGDEALLITGEDDDENSNEFMVTIIAPAKSISKEKKTPKKEVVKIDTEPTEEPKAIKTSKPKKNVANDTPNLFVNSNPNTDEENVITPGSLINDSNKIKSVAASAKGAVNTLEYIGGKSIGRPHGDEDLRKYDVPAYLRRRELKFNDTTESISDVSDTNTTPNEPADTLIIQNLINDAQVNRFTRQLSEKGLKNR